MNVTKGEVGIGRALLKNTNIVVLDEVIVDVDSVIKTWFRSAVMDADQLAEFDNPPTPCCVAT